MRKFCIQCCRTDAQKIHFCLLFRPYTHLKRSLMGRESVVAITEGRLDFGTWEQIFYYEFDGKRDKRLLIKVIGE